MPDIVYIYVALKTEVLTRLEHGFTGNTGSTPKANGSNLNHVTGQLLSPSHRQQHGSMFHVNPLNGLITSIKQTSDLSIGLS